MSLEPYHFQQNTEIVLQHGFGKTLRVSPNNLNQVDGNGEYGKYATWYIERENSSFCKLKNTVTNKYLRIYERGELIDVEGVGGPFTKFKIHFVQLPNVILLESNHFPNHYVGIDPNGRAIVGKGGPYCQFHIYRANNISTHTGVNIPQIIKNTMPIISSIFPQRPPFEQPPPFQQPPPFEQPSYNHDNNLFIHPYLFQKNNLIIIQSIHGGHLRIDPNNLKYMDGNGGYGEYAQWHAELNGDHIIKLRNAKSGQYLRMYNDGKSIDVDGVGGEYCNFRYHFDKTQNNIVKLESAIYKGCYIAIKPNHNVEIGVGGPHCSLQLFRKD